MAAGGAAYVAWRVLRPGREGSLEGEVVLITGGSRGLGLLLARRLAAVGAKLAICARDEQELEAAREELAHTGADVLALRCDVTSREEVEELVQQVTAQYGWIDVVINNAGIIQAGPLEAMTLEDFEQAMAVSFWGTVHTTMAVLPAMRRRGHGRICNITSIGGTVPVPHLLPYVSGKFAAVGFSEGLRAEVAKDGVTVTTVVPGLMRTGSPANAWFKGQAPAEHAWFSLGDATPLTSMSAERAADRIVRAIADGETYVVLSWQAKLLRLAHGVAPATTLRALSWIDRMLPSAEGGSREAVRGMDVATGVSPSFWTRLLDRAARRNHEYAGSHEPSRAHAEQAGLEP
jgi:short-subunit dehydrogenase